MHIATHSAIRTIDHLGELLKHLGGPFNTLELHRTKCSKLILNVIAPAYLKELIDDIGLKPYSIILDESTDIGTHKYMAFCVRYHSVALCDMVTDFLGFVEIEKATAEVLRDVFLDFLVQSKLDVKNLIGIGTDGASNLCGKNKSLFTLLKEIVPDLQLIKCICHSLNICSAHACEELPSSLEFLVREIRNWFSHSSLRQLIYKSLFEALYDGKTPPKLLQLSTTRWIAWYSCIKSILEQFLALKTHFNIIAQSKEGCYTSRTLNDMLKDDTNLLYLMFLKPILFEVTQVNIVFQSTNVDISKAYSDLKRLLISIINRILKPNHITNIIPKNADGKMLNVIDVKLLKNALRFPDSHLPLNCIDFGYQFEEQSKLSIATGKLTKVQLELVQQRSSNFLFRLCHEMCNRLPDNLQIIEKIKYLSPAECFNQFSRPKFSELPIELAGKNAK